MCESESGFKGFWAGFRFGFKPKKAESRFGFKKKQVDSNPDWNLCLSITALLALLPPGASYGQMDSNPDSDSNTLDSDSRK